MEGGLSLAPRRGSFAPEGTFKVVGLRTLGTVRAKRRTPSPGWDFWGRSRRRFRGRAGARGRTSGRTLYPFHYKGIARSNISCCRLRKEARRWSWNRNFHVGGARWSRWVPRRGAGGPSPCFFAHSPRVGSSRGGPRVPCGWSGTRGRNPLDSGFAGERLCEVWQSNQTPRCMSYKWCRLLVSSRAGARGPCVSRSRSLRSRLCGARGCDRSAAAVRYRRGDSTDPPQSQCALTPRQLLVSLRLWVAAGPSDSAPAPATRARGPPHLLPALAGTEAGAGWPAQHASAFEAPRSLALGRALESADTRLRPARRTWCRTRCRLGHRSPVQTRYPADRGGFTSLH